MFRRILWLCACVAVVNSSIAQENLPVPKESRDRLFYLQRDPNANTVVYDMRYLPDGSPDISKPVHPYWIKYVKGGVLEELLPMEEKLAYGVISELIDDKNKVFKINLVAYKKTDIILKQNTGKGDKKYNAYVNANGKTLVLSKVFLRLENANTFKPTLVYIEFTGRDEKTGKMVTERVKPI